ncbi:DJ-1 family glyoxalase III [Butyrivibrio sp. AE3004]|uniref:DJ-1 family glyoxalase III n=1 Tax=Butyrivibrio sp. AE3004 TaxID=1506994 RepID=UPI00049417F2|nr:DJ-1 family glyoxalase III [Butyrivibrio sp. AE3004]
MSDKRAAVLLADGFEEGESLFVVDILRRCGVCADTVSVEGEMVRGSHDIYVKVDCLIGENKFDDYDMVVIPGGMPGAENLRNNPLVVKWVKKFDSEGKYIAAICAGPMVLKEAGITAGRTLTSYPADKYRELFKDSNYVDDNKEMEKMVVVDDNIITSRGPATTLPFAFKLAEVLGGDVEKVKEGILYNAMQKAI